MSPALSVTARRLMAGALLVAGLCAFGTARAEADEAPPGAWIKRWIAEPPMAGNWFGARDVLNAWGINPSIRYATDLQASVAGGQHRGQAYAGQPDRSTYCLNVPRTVFAQWTLPWVVSPMVTSLFEQN